MKHYNIFQALILSFYSKYLYRDVLENWRGIGFSLLFVGTFILTICTGFGLRGIIDEYVNDWLPVVTEGMPDLEVKDGRLYVEGDEEFRFEYADEEVEESFLFLINPKEPNFVPKRNQAAIVLDDYEFAVYQSDGTSDIEPWTEFDDWELNQEDLVEFAQDNAWWVPWALSPFIFVFYYIFYIFVALCWGFLAWINSRLFRLSIDYAEAVRISVSAMVPALMLTSLGQLVEFPLLGFFPGLLVTYLYILLGLYWISKGIDEQPEA